MTTFPTGVINDRDLAGVHADASVGKPPERRTGN